MASRLAAARRRQRLRGRLDKVPQKAFLGFLSWLGVRGKAGRAARLPVVFNMTPGSEPVDASPPVQLQVTPGAGDPIPFETQLPLRIFPSRLVALVATDSSNDSFYLPPPGIFDATPPQPVPDAGSTGSLLGLTVMGLLCLHRRR